MAGSSSPSSTGALRSTGTSTRRSRSPSSSGCGSIELMAPKYFPVLKKARAQCAIGTIDMGPDPPFAKGFNNPKYRDRVMKATREAIDACAEFGYKNVICFTGYREGIPDDVGADNCVEGFKKIVGHAEKKGVTLCLEMLNSRAAPSDEGPPRLSGRPYRLLHRHHQAGRLAQPETAVRHLSRPDHGRRHHPPDSPASRTISATSTPPAIRAVASSTTSKRSPTSRSWRRLLEIGYQGYVGQEFIPTRDPLEGLRQAVSLCDV